ncbi:DUF4149 domain-containing protein [Sulfurospirillum deleyianum]|uniref:Putative integral membrane protein n=1 Tax=Sulfurospirillum deleyianum (strain ATCC 51133 / DSM 6946 / 5175) TaxID=525898 RepID=D1B2X7_SULD5|nr:DUF4149 domain-containing protein [Sulfurospirillum deleyianum]ACZ12447.1 putative integral membrane protein [Sulfurospirillum deleyianum DSM 6946]
MKGLTLLYLGLLGIAIGVEIAAGALVAPVIFFPQDYLGEGVLSHFQSGILMTQVFLKMNILIGFVALYSMIYEVQVMMMRKNFDLFSLLSSLVVTIATGLFLFYYTPFIVHAQHMGAEQTATEIFYKMHKQSELVIKILMIAQLGLFVRRGWLLAKR